MTGETADNFLLFLVLVASIGLHEWAHAVTADKLGDPLPRSEGRVTLNPLAHADPIGTFLIPLLVIFLSPGFAVIGWGKPVRISLPNEKTRVRDDLLVTAAGPFSNLCIAVLASVTAGVVFGLTGEVNEAVKKLVEIVITLNCVLLLFNLIPIPPLDGSHFLKYAVRMKEETYAKLASYGFVILIVLINLKPFQAMLYKGIAFTTGLCFDLMRMTSALFPQVGG